MARPRRCPRCCATISLRMVCSVEFMEPTTIGLGALPHPIISASDRNGTKLRSGTPKRLMDCSQDNAKPKAALLRRLFGGVFRGQGVGHVAELNGGIRAKPVVQPELDFVLDQELAFARMEF